ncbi:hypothetical protein [Salinibacterium sp.]|nr:hypothetical protein [Salinibacterium sp.]
MVFLLVILAVVAVASIVATLRLMATDGHRRTPTRTCVADRQ